MIRHYRDIVPERTQLILSFLILSIFTGVAYFEGNGICLTADITAVSSMTDDPATDRCAIKLKQTAFLESACIYQAVLPAITRSASFEDNGYPRSLIIPFSPGRRAPPPFFS
jgi:hypothetical protein